VVVLVNLFSVFVVCTFCLVVLILIYLSYRNREKTNYIHAVENILKLGGAGFLIFDNKDRLKYANTIALSYFNALSDDRIVGSLTDFIAYIFDHASDDTQSLYSFRALQGANDTSHFREVVVGDSGHSYLVEMYKGDNASTIALIRDVSVLKAHNEDISVLNQINTELNLAIEAISSAVFILDPRQRHLPVIFCNRMCKEIMGLPLDEDDFPAFSTLLGLIGECDDVQSFMDCVHYKKSLQKQVQFEKEGAVSWYDFRLSPVLNAIGNVDLYVGVLTDITELKQREVEFYKARKLESLGQLSAGIAHDFNNILSIIEGYARMIEMNRAKPDTMISYAGKIKESSIRAAGLTKKMMAFARHKTHQERVSDIGKVIREQSVLLRPLLDESIVFKIDSDDGDLFGRCAEDDFVQIIMNLVVNARDAFGDLGVIHVALNKKKADYLPYFVKDRECDYLCLKVRDNGMGMPKDVCERIFDPFFTTKEQGKGTGLGLSVVYGLVKDMGGYIDVRSEQGVGTEISVYIPHSAVLTEPAKAVVRDASGELSFQGYTALVVEDEPDLMRIIAEVLSRHDMNVLEASCGDDALVLQEDHLGEIDIMITDLVMPGMNGLKLAEMMQALRPDIHVIYMSGYPSRGVDAKVDIPDDAIFISKPIDFDLLCDSVYYALTQEQPMALAINA